MEGKRSSPQPGDLLPKIREFTRSIIEDLSIGRLPSISIDRFRNYCTNSTGNCFCSSDLAKGKEILTLKKECQAHRLDVLLRVLLVVQQLLQENRHGSKRDIYYMHPSVFSEQSVVDRAINDICILMQCSRHNLNVVSVGKGLVMGWLRFLEAGRKFDCINSPNTAHPIPVHVEEVKDIISVAHYILVVEKESVFQRLANDKFCSTNRCIVITGRGYPDIPTRRFLRLLIDELRLPAYCLVDCDPYGFDILTTYRFGSMQMAYDAKFLRVPEIRWLGAFPSDYEKFGFPNQCLLPLTAEDTRRTEALLLRCYLQREVPLWRLELELMLQRGVKFEIEALSAHSISFLSKEYIPSKIQAYNLDEVEEKMKSLRAAAKYTVEDDQSSLDKFQALVYSSALTVPAKATELYLDLRRLIEEHVRGFTEPLSEKLLPDLHPAEQHVFTLVLDLNETLVYSDWKRDRGWRTFKRPGVDAFLEHMAQFYEIVVYSDQQSMYVDPVVERLDKKQCVRFRLSRAATKYQDQKHYRDLSKLNRDPAKILYVSGHALESSIQSENCVEIKPWKLEDDDTELVDLIPFLEYVARNRPADIRPVLASYKGQNIPKEFMERSKDYQRKMQEQKQRGSLWRR